MTTGLNHGYGGVKVNKKLNVKGFCTDLAYDLVGSVLYAAGIVCFVNPANMAPGGMSGVAILLNYLWGLPIGTMTIVLNIPLLILSYIFLGKSLTWKTVKSLVISSLMVDLVMARYAPIYAGDRMIGGVFGGVLMDPRHLRQGGGGRRPGERPAGGQGAGAGRGQRGLAGVRPAAVRQAGGRPAGQPGHETHLPDSQRGGIEP